MSTTDEGPNLDEIGDEAGDADRLSTIITALMDDRRQREAQIAEERAQREREFERQQERRQREMDEKMEVVMRLVENVGKSKSNSGEGAVRVAKLTDDDDIEGYLTTFERQMAAYEIDEARWAFLLAPKLSGRAQQAYMAVDTTDAGDYRAIKKAILQRYDVNEESYRRKFHARRRKTEESYTNLATDLMDLGRRWLQDCKTLADALDKIAIEQLLSALPEEIRVWVREHKPETCAEAGHWADEYAQARSAPLIIPGKAPPVRRREEIQCLRCGKPGHIARFCRAQQPPNPRLPQPPPQRGPRPPQPQLTTQPNSQCRVTRCYSCGQVGHIAMHCPAKALFCDEEDSFGAGVEGEVQEVVREGLVEGKPAKVLLDTGSARTLVRRELVPEGKVLVGQGVAIRCAHGENVRYPLADIVVEVGGRQFAVRAGVADQLPVQILLGRDVPILLELLTENPSISQSELAAVTTRSQLSRVPIAEPSESIVQDQVVVAPLAPDQVVVDEESEGDNPSMDFADDLFEGGRERPQLTRSQKRAARHEHAAEHGTSDRTGVSSMTRGQLIECQVADATLEAARAEAAGGGDTTRFFYLDGMLYRRKKSDADDATTDQLVLPVQCRQQVMAVAHAIPLGGHLGKRKTTQRVTQRFYWPTISRDVAEFCHSCKSCQLDSSRRVSRAPLIPLPIISEPFRRIAMDIVGPLPKSRSGKRFILVVCDYATRYPEAVALRSIDAEHIAEELVQIFSRVGIPEEILTDQGTNFMSQLLAEVYKLMRVKAIRTSPYHPQTDGLVERFNQTLKAMLRKTATSEGKDWDTLIPYVLFAYREVPQASTGFSPFELLYGRSVRGPLDVVRETWEATTKRDPNVVSYVLAMREKLDKMTELVQENLSRAQSYQKTWYDRTARVREFGVGDRVVVLLPTSTHKLRAQWQGPYTIVRKFGEANYVVDMKDKGKRYRTFHINMLKRWHEPNHPQDRVLYTSTPDADEELPSWDDAGAADPAIGEQLSREQQQSLKQLTREFRDVFNNAPGRTVLAEHTIQTGVAKPVQQQTV